MVRVVAPASPFRADALERGVAVLEGWGLQVRMREDIVERRHYLAGSPERRAAELAEAFSDPEAAAVLPVRGGYGVTTVLPLLDPQPLRSSPKILVGSSDLTALLQWAVDCVGMTCIHGPMVGALGQGEDSEGAARLRSLLFEGGKAPVLQAVGDDAHQWCIAPGLARGRAMGGSLSLLAASCGTPFQAQTEGAVLFLEDVGERPYRVDRLLVQLQQSGLFEGLAALVLGDFVGCEEPGGELDWRTPIDRIFRSLPIPVLAGIPFGHGKPNLAIPFGVEVEVDAGAGSLSFREKTLA